MSDRNDDDAFARNVAAHYAGPPLTASQRTRFDARLEERLQRSSLARPRSWIAAVAVAAAVAALLFRQAGSIAPTNEQVAHIDANDGALESATTPEEWILAMGSVPSSGVDDGLPADYVAISDLLLAGQ